LKNPPRPFLFVRPGGRVPYGVRLLSERRYRGLVVRGVERGIIYIRWSITLLYNHLRQNRHGAARNRGLVETPSLVIVHLSPGQSTSPTPNPPDPPCLFLSFAQERKRSKGGSYVTVGQQAGSDCLPMALRGDAGMAGVERAYSVTWAEYPAVKYCFIVRWSWLMQCPTPWQRLTLHRRVTAGCRLALRA
jgi:hypothetical protein